MLNLLKHELLSRWSAIIGWGIGLALFGAMYLGTYPQVSEQMAALADIPLYRAMGIDMYSFEGYIASLLVGYVPLILGIYVIIASTATLAGEEEGGTLELIMAMPLGRWQIVSMKAIALAVALFLILVIAAAGNALVLGVVKATVEVDLVPRQLFVSILGTWPFTIAFFMIGLFLGAYLPNRRSAALVTTVIFVASYFGKNLAGLAPSLEFIKPLSLFSYFDTSTTTFSDGIKAKDVSILLAVAAIFFLLALLSFHRRNVTVGAWPWQRSRISG